MSIAVTTPTGQIGSRVARILAGAGAPLTLLARDPARLPDDLRARADVRRGSLEDAAFVREATRGAEALFLLVPPDYATRDWRAFQLGIARAAADAVRENGVRHVVLLSSGGAHRDDLLAISRVGETERMLEGAAPHVLSLRAGFFMENFLSAVPTIREMGAVFMGISPESRAAFVATRDIADVAARHLLDRSWSGHRVLPVQGPEDLSFREAAERLAEGTGRPVRYVQVDDEQVKAALLGAGASEHVADEYTRMFRRLDETGFDREPRTPEATTPTTLAEWARETLRPLVGEPEPAGV